METKDGKKGDLRREGVSQQADIYLEALKSSEQNIQRTIGVFYEGEVSHLITAYTQLWRRVPRPQKSGIQLSRASWPPVGVIEDMYSKFGVKFGAQMYKLVYPELKTLPDTNRHLYCLSQAIWPNCVYIGVALSSKTWCSQEFLAFNTRIKNEIDLLAILRRRE